MSSRAVVCTAVLVSAAVAAAPLQTPKSGLDLASFNTTIRPQDDLFRYVNGRWLETVAIPPDRVAYGTFAEMAERTELALRAIVEEAAASRGRRGSRLQLIGDLYRSFMDEDRINALGAAPIQGELARIDAIKTATDLAAEAGFLGAAYAGGPFPMSLATSADDAERLIVQVSQGGARMPSRDYYLNLDPAFVEARAKYEEYLTTVFTLLGRSDAQAAARQVMTVETAIARIQLTPLESRQALTTVRRSSLSDLAREMPGFDWKAWARPQGIDRAAAVVLLQPAFFKRFSTLVPAISIEAWKNWLTARHVFQMTPYLSQPFVDARFAVFGRLLAGLPELSPRWKAGVAMASTFLGDAVGQAYVEKHFSSVARSRSEQIVATVIKAYRQAISEATWLSRETRNEALAKLSRIAPRVGHPDRWRDYAGLVIRPDDLFGNWTRLQQYANNDRVSRVTGGVGPGGWLISAQATNAFYNPATNEIVLTAAMLQPPHFDAEADDAVNYGALGATVGHEITHAFDERGRRFDATGDLRQWWTGADEDEYRRRSRGLVEAFSAFSPIAGLQVNGELTLPENLADLVGLSVAFRAYRLSLAGRPAPVVDGFTGEQRFFLSYARMWRMKVRDDYMRQWLLSLPYSPEEFRTNGTIGHVPAFYEAFTLTEGDRLYRAPSDRVAIW